MTTQNRYSQTQKKKEKEKNENEADMPLAWQSASSLWSM